LDSVTASGLIPEIGALATSLQNQVNDPATSIYQQQVGTQLVKLRDVLSAMETNNFPPGWKQVLTEHELWYFIGNDLLRVLDEIFARNAITPSLALKEILDIQTVLTGT